MPVESYRFVANFLLQTYTYATAISITTILITIAAIPIFIIGAETLLL